MSAGENMLSKVKIINFNNFRKEVNNKDGWLSYTLAGLHIRKLLNFKHNSASKFF